MHLCRHHLLACTFLLAVGGCSREAGSDLDAGIVCPRGTRLVERAYAHGRGYACAREDDTLHGPYRSRWLDGKKLSTGSFDRGKRHGLWREWDRQGQLKYEGTYHRGTRHGKWTEYIQGRVWKQGTYREGQQHGTWVLFDEQGRKVFEGEYQEGTRNGPAVTWTREGKRCSGSYRDGAKHGRWVCYHGRETDAVWTEGDYLHGKEQGRWNMYHPNGQLARTGTYHMGARNGTWTDHDSEGNQLSSFEYKNNTIVEATGVR